MKKIVFILAASIILASCSAPAGDVDAKRKQLLTSKQKLHDLQAKIETLEQELEGTVEEEVVSVTATQLENQVFEHFLEVTGNVEADQDVDVSPEMAGIIESIMVKEGDRVSKGQLLAKLKSEALNRSLEELEIQLELANTTFERQKNLWDQNIGSELQYLQAKTNKESIEKRIESIKAQIDMAVVKSPVDGVVDIIYQKKGQMGSPQMPFAKVMNIDQVKIYADVSEAYLTKINEKDKVRVSFPALGMEEEAPIQRIGNTIDPNNRTFRVRINLNNPKRAIKPNLVSIIRIRDYFNENAIVVPSLLVKEDFKGNYTYILNAVNGRDIAKKVYVKLGVTDNNLTEVTEGLSAGMKIISEGFNQVVDGSIVKL